MDEYLRLETLFFCSSNCNFLKFSAQNLSLLPIFFNNFNDVLTTVNTTDICNYNFTKAIEWVSNRVFSVRYFVFSP